MKETRLPPPPVRTSVKPIDGDKRARVVVDLPKRDDSIEILATVIEVQDRAGKRIAKVEIKVSSSQTQVEVTVPYRADGYKVFVYNVNSVGVSAGAPFESAVVHERTMSGKMLVGVPLMLGDTAVAPLYFTSNSAVLDAGDKRALRQIARVLIASGDQVLVTGRARLGGDTPKRLAELSTQRARNVAMFLSAHGVQVWMRYFGVGPLGGTGGWKDRRVEIRTSAEPITSAAALRMASLLPRGDVSFTGAGGKHTG